jgi:4-pyridoxolactonase
MLVELEDSRPLLFIADVSYTSAAYANDQQAGFHNNPVDGVRSIRAVKRLAKERDAQVVFTHDMEVFKTYTLAPEPFTAGGGR